MRWDEIYDFAAVKDLSKSDAVFQSVINNNKAKRLPHVKCICEERKDCIKVWLMEDDFAILPTGFLKSLIFRLFPRIMSPKDGEVGTVFTIMAASLAPEAIMKYN